MAHVRRFAGAGASLALGAAGGWAACGAGMPLPWLVGPLLLCGVASVLGVAAPPCLNGVRRSGQALAGTAIGLQMTPVVMLQLLHLLPLAVGTAAFASILGALIAILLMRRTGLDPATAFFSMIPAGVAETGRLALRHGAAVEPVVLAQTLRVGVIVLTVPALTAQLAHGAASLVVTVPAGSLPEWGMAGLAAAGGGLLLARLHLPNPWLLGPLIGVTAVSTTGLVAARLPAALLILAQVLIGTALGFHFQAKAMRRLPRVAVASLLAVVANAAVLAGLAWGVAGYAGLPAPTLVLAAAPAGIAEMVLTAQSLRLDAAVITGFHFTRIILVMLWCQAFYRLFRWSLLRWHAA